MACCKPFTQLTPAQYRNTLVAKLEPLADCLRDLKVQLGARAWRVYLVWTRWSGEYRGDGIEEVLTTEEVLPVPAIGLMSGVQLQLQNIGLDEVGTLRVFEISPSYTEDKLLGRDAVGNPIAKNQNFYWEIQFFLPDGQLLRRRFVPRNVPAKDPTKFQWEIQLIRATRDRDRQGEP